MATKKKLLEAAAGAAGGAGLNVEQVFSTYLYEGNGDYLAIENEINLGQSFGSGSAYFDGNDYITASSGYLTSIGTGDFTIEGWWYFKDLTARTYFTRCWSFGTGLSDDVTLNVNTSGQLQYRNNDSTQFTSSSNISANEWNHIALCRNSGTTTLYLNGISVGSASNNVDFSTVANNSFYVGVESDGNGGYMNGYASNIRIVNGTAVYTSNFTSPTSELTAISGTSLLILQGDSPFVDNSSSALTITQNGDPEASTFGPFDAADAGEGGLVWVKRRDVTESNVLVDTERGSSQTMYSDLTVAELTRNTVTSFNSNGFSLGDNSASNISSGDFASWTFRKAPKFFTCLTYTGTGSAQNISHDLGTTVGTLIVKRTDSADNWTVWHRGVNSGSGSSFLNLNLTSGYSNSATRWNSTAPTSTQFSVGTHASVNASGGTYVAYLFAHNDGDGEFGPTGDQDIIKCGSYTTDGSGNATIDLNFEPQWLMVKDANATGDWYMIDIMRGIVTGGADPYVRANSNSAEATTINFIDLTATGFNANYSIFANKTFIYIAIRRGPMAVPTDATDVFNVSYHGQTSGYGGYLGAPVDMAIRRPSISTSADWQIASRLSNGLMYTNNTNAEVSAGDRFENMKGVYTTTGTNTDQYHWMWQRRSSFCDVVAYTGNGTAGRTVSHNLGVAPEMMWIKSRDDVRDWRVYHSALGASSVLNLNSTSAAFASTSSFNGTDPDASNFTLGSLSVTNGSSENYIAYLFASLDGVSKVGSFTGTGSSQTIDCGFSSGARFVLIKGADVALGWVVFDVERGIVTGNDPFLQLQSTAAENNGNDHIDPHSSGFIVNPSMIASGSTYIFYAIA